MNWYPAKSAGRGQGLVIDQDTGRNVAVAYDEKDTQLLAAAPQLQAACDTLESSARVVADILHAKGEQDDPLLSERLSDLWQACNTARAAVQASRQPGVIAKAAESVEAIYGDAGKCGITLGAPSDQAPHRCGEPKGHTGAHRCVICNIAWEDPKVQKS